MREICCGKSGRLTLDGAIVTVAATLPAYDFPAMQTLSPAPSGKTQQIRDDLDQSRRRGPLQHIQIPPCPELLAQLQHAMSAPEPDLNLVARIASSDVAMAATLEDEVITASCDLDMGKRYRQTIFDFARHREPEAYRLIVERKGAVPRPET